RLLPVGPADERGCAAREEQEPERRRHQRRHERQHLPLRHLRAHQGSHQGRRDLDAQRLNEAPAMTSTTSVTDSSRRGFLKTAAIASGGLLLGVSVPGLRPAQAAGRLHAPNAWVHIADDNTITLISARSEMGQGVYTSMPMLIAEELGVDLDRIRVAIAPPD